MGKPTAPEAPAAETPRAPEVAAPAVEPTPETVTTPEVAKAEATSTEQAQQAADAAHAAALDEGATPKEAEHAAAVAEADVATSAADVTAERPIPPAPETPALKAAVDAVENPKTPTQLPSEKFPLTPQGQAIADAVVADHKDVKVEAKAGAGKTTILEAIARRIKDLRNNEAIVYIAFNKSVQTEAEGRMPDNVESRTGHSIAWTWAGKDITDKRDRGGLRRADELATHLGINTSVPTEGGDPIDRTMQAQIVMRAVDRFANSADDNLSQHSFTDPEMMTDDLHGLSEPDKVKMLGYAAKAWTDIKNPDGKIAISFDHIRKMWALSKPDLSKSGSGLRRPAKVLFLDEAQDTPPVLAKVVADQKMQKVIVGDADQAIYGFTGATDYLSTAKADVALPLTKSWRFGPLVADAGNRFLQLLNSKDRVVGGGAESHIVSDMKNPDAILVRSNGGMLGEILREQEAGRLVGVPKGTKADLLSLVETARYLKGEGRAPNRMHEDLAPFRTWGEFEKAAEEGDDPKLTMLNDILKQYGTDGLDEIVQKVIELDDSSKGDALAGVTTTVEGDMLSLGGKTFLLNQRLKAAGLGFGKAGFRWDSERKVWFVKGDEAHRQAALDKLRNLAAGSTDPSQEPDVVVSTAHKAKGLEWKRVRIGADFKGPKVSKATGKEVMPKDEELRLAYVAVTRAEHELDPGSLSWVYEKTSPNGGTPGEKPHAPVEAPKNDIAEPSVPTPVEKPVEKPVENAVEPTVNEPDSTPAEPAHVPDVTPDHTPTPDVTPDTGVPGAGVPDSIKPEGNETDPNDPNLNPDAPELRDDPSLSRGERKDRQQERRRRRRMRNWLNNFGNNNNNNNQNNNPGGLLGALPFGVKVPEIPYNGHTATGHHAGAAAGVGAPGHAHTGQHLSTLSPAQLHAEHGHLSSIAAAALAKNPPDKHTAAAANANIHAITQIQANQPVPAIPNHPTAAGVTTPTTPPSTEHFNVSPAIQQRANTYINKAHSMGLNVQVTQSTGKNGNQLTATITNRDGGWIKVHVSPSNKNGTGTKVWGEHAHSATGAVIPLAATAISGVLANQPVANTAANNVVPAWTAKNPTTGVQSLVDHATGVSTDIWHKDGQWWVGNNLHGQLVNRGHAGSSRKEAMATATKYFLANRHYQQQIANIPGGLPALAGLNQGQFQTYGQHHDVSAIRYGSFVGVVTNDGHGNWSGRITNLNEPHVKNMQSASGTNRDHVELTLADKVEHAHESHVASVAAAAAAAAKLAIQGPPGKEMNPHDPNLNSGIPSLADHPSLTMSERGHRRRERQRRDNRRAWLLSRTNSTPTPTPAGTPAAGAATAAGGVAAPNPAGTANPTTTTPQPTASGLLVNGALPLSGMVLPKDSATGQYSAAQINYLAEHSTSPVLINTGSGAMVPGTFLPTKPSDGGKFSFYPLGSTTKDHIVLLSPNQLLSIQAITKAEIPGNLTNAGNLGRGTLVTANTGKKNVTGLLAGTTPKGNALIHDHNGNLVQVPGGRQVRPIHGAYANGFAPTQATFAPTPGVYAHDNGGLAVGVPGQYSARIMPNPTGGFNYTITGAPSSNLGTITGHSPTEAAAKAAIEDHLYLAVSGEHPAHITTLPGNSPAHRDVKKRELADVLAELNPTPAEPAAATDQPSEPESVKPEALPAPVAGSESGWVPTGELMPGDVARVDGDNGNGEATTRTGHVLGTPETVEVNQPGKLPAKGTRTVVGDNPNGSGDREAILSPQESVSAHVMRDVTKDGTNPQPRSATEAQVLSGNVGDTLPVDSNGLGVYPGSVVKDRNGRTGVVTETSQLDVAVKWAGERSDKRVRPNDVTVETQNRPDGWTKTGQMVRLGSVVTDEKGRHGIVSAISGDSVTVDSPEGERTYYAGELSVVGMDDGHTDAVRDPAFDAPLSPEGVDVRPTAPRKPDPIDSGTPSGVVNLRPEQQQLFDSLGLDVDQTSLFDVQQGAARVRNGEPITNEHATALSTFIQAQIDGGGLTSSKARGLKQLVNRINATRDRINGTNTHTEAPAPEVPALTRVDAFTPGDVIALPDNTTGSVEWGTVIATRPLTNDASKPLGASDVLLELPDGSRKRSTLADDAEAYSLTALPDPTTQVPFEQAGGPVEADRAYTEPRVKDRLEASAAAVVDAALADGQNDATIGDVGARAHAAAASGDDVKEQHNAGRRLETSLESSGVDQHSADLAYDGADAAAAQVAEQVRETIDHTTADATSLPGESDKTAAGRVRDRLLKDAAAGVDFQHAADAAFKNAEAVASDTVTGRPTPTQQAVARRQLDDALRADLFSMADQLAAMGNVDDANALSLVAARLAGLPDPIHVQAAVQAVAMGRDPAAVASLTARIRAMFARARARFFESIQRSMVGKGARSFKAALHAARATWTNDARDMNSVVADAAAHLTNGGDRNLPGHVTGEPVTYADRVAFWLGALPKDSNVFGQVPGRTGFGRILPAALRSGKTLGFSEDPSAPRLDRATDGGPGKAASAQSEALHGLGRAHMDEVAARIRAIHPDLGNDPSATVADAKRYLDSMSADHRGDIKAAELTDLRTKALADYTDKRDRFVTARRSALLDVIRAQRPVGPSGSAKLNVQGRSESAAEVKALHWAEQFLPTDLIASMGTIEAQAGRMSKYDDGTITVAPLGTSHTDGSAYASSALHGLAWHLEHNVPAIGSALWALEWRLSSTGQVGSRRRVGKNSLGYLRDMFPGLGLDKSRTVRPGSHTSPWAGEETPTGEPVWLLALALDDLLNGTSYLDNETLAYIMGILGYMGRNA
jgi:superfamily I DNA/RNA helicase